MVFFPNFNGILFFFHFLFSCKKSEKNSETNFNNFLQLKTFVV